MVKTHPLDDCAATAAFILGKWEDRSAIPALVEFMKLNFVDPNCESVKTRAVRNAMDALDHLGEEIIPWENGYKRGSGNDYERDHELAVRYLRKKDQLCQ